MQDYRASDPDSEMDSSEMSSVASLDTPALANEPNSQLILFQSKSLQEHKYVRKSKHTSGSPEVKEEPFWNDEEPLDQDQGKKKINSSQKSSL